MNTKNEQLQQQLQQLATALQQAHLWDETAPPSEKLMSREPFCVDTLAFEQWLQWVFIPRLSGMLSSPTFNGLPNTSDVHSMADYAFKDYPQETTHIRALVKHIDNTLNHFSV